MFAIEFWVNINEYIEEVIVEAKELEVNGLENLVVAGGVKISFGDKSIRRVVEI